MRLREKQPILKLPESERLMMIAWLSLITGFPKSYWQQKDDYHIKKLYEANVEEHGYELMEI
jgi:hypothetical protein